MSSRKKLFESEDFDKKKKLFSPEDFDKEPDATVETKGVDINPSPTPNEPKSKAWLWILLGVIVLGVIGYMLFSKSSDKVAETLEQEVETVAESSVPTGTIATEGADIEGVAPNDGNEVDNTSDTKNSDVVDAPATVDNTSTVPSSTQVNESNVTNDVEAEAMKVIRGDYGVGQERKDKLGSKYQTIQSRVNELKREGFF